MRKVSVSRPSAPSAGLQLPLEYVASCLRVPVASLLRLEQTDAEVVFSKLFDRLQLTHVRQIVEARNEERKDAQMASKVGTISSAANLNRTAESEYRLALTTVIVQQATKLGFKGVVNPALASITADKKLALRIIDHLAKRAFGPPPTEAAPAAAAAAAGSNGRSVPGDRQREARQTPLAAELAHVNNHAHSPAPASSPTSATRRTSAATDSSSTRRASLQATSTPSGRAGKAVTQVATKPRPQQEAIRTHEPPHDSTNDDSYTDETFVDHDDAASRDAPPLSAAAPFDGRFADVEFDSRAAAVAARRPSSAVRSTRVPRSIPARSDAESDVTAGELRAELSAERSRHSATALELRTLKSLYDQLINERGEERFGARRVTLLKSQNMQLERQLSMLAAAADTRRAAISEINTIVHGLDEAVENELSRSQRSQLQFSSEEEQFLQSSAPLAAESLYAGAMSHLNLDRVHALESSLAALHESCVHAHAALSGLAAVAPVQLQAAHFLRHAGQASKSSATGDAKVAATAPTLQSLLDSLRSSAFDLQSLGVLLPSHTAFVGHTHLMPADAQRDWSWIGHLQQAMRRRGVPSRTAELITRRAAQEETHARIRAQMHEAELRYHRRTQQAQLSCLRSLIQQTQTIVDDFRTNNNALYADATKELSQCMADWHRNSSHVNVPRLLGTLQHVFPCVQQMLQREAARDTGDSTAGDVSTGGDLPEVARKLECGVEDALQQFHDRMAELRGQQEALDEEITQTAVTTFDSQLPRGGHDDMADGPASSHPRQLQSSSGRSTSRSHSHEPPPFQF